MPAKSQAQRAYLNSHFGHEWVKEHGFDNKGKLPARKGKKAVKKKKAKKVKTKAKKKGTKTRKPTGLGRY